MKTATVRKIHAQLEVTDDIDFVIIVIGAAHRAQSREFGRVSRKCDWALDELLQLAEAKYEELKGQLPD